MLYSPQGGNSLSSRFLWLLLGNQTATLNKSASISTCQGEPNTAHLSFFYGGL